ncbi:hypothetical protein Tco_0491220 [Tanacetum coccineum]
MPAGEKATGHPCSALAHKYKKADPREIPIEILNIKGKRHIFQIHCSSSTGKGSCDFAVDDILDRPATSEHASSSEKNHPRFTTLIRIYNRQSMNMMRVV